MSEVSLPGAEMNEIARKEGMESNSGIKVLATAVRVSPETLDNENIGQILVARIDQTIKANRQAMEAMSRGDTASFSSWYSKEFQTRIGLGQYQQYIGSADHDQGAYMEQIQTFGKSAYEDLRARFPKEQADDEAAETMLLHSTEKGLEGDVARVAGIIKESAETNFGEPVRIIKRLGSGAEGAVYLLRLEKSHYTCCVKYSVEGGDQTSARSPSEREALKINTLNYDLHQGENGLSAQEKYLPDILGADASRGCFFMSLAPGFNIGENMSSGDPKPIEFDSVVQSLHLLTAAKERGWVNNDPKPLGNMFWDGDAHQLTMVDFGLWEKGTENVTGTKNADMASCIELSAKAAGSTARALFKNKAYGNVLMRGYYGLTDVEKHYFLDLFESKEFSDLPGETKLLLKQVSGFDYAAEEARPDPNEEALSTALYIARNKQVPEVLIPELLREQYRQMPVEANYLEYDYAKVARERRMELPVRAELEAKARVDLITRINGISDRDLTRADILLDPDPGTKGVAACLQSLDGRISILNIPDIASAATVGAEDNSSPEARAKAVDAFRQIPDDQFNQAGLFVRDVYLQINDMYSSGWWPALKDNLPGAATEITQGLHKFTAKAGELKRTGNENPTEWQALRGEMRYALEAGARDVVIKTWANKYGGYEKLLAAAIAKGLSDRAVWKLPDEKTTITVGEMKARTIKIKK